MNHVDALMGATAFVPPGVIVMAATSIDDLRARQQELMDASSEIVDKADSEERDLADDEIETIENNRAEVDKLTKQIAARESIKPVGQGRVTKPEMTVKGPDGKPDRRVPATARDSMRHGFRDLGEFAVAVRSHALGNVDNEGVRKVMAAATTYGNEGTGADGGFAVPPEAVRTIQTKVDAEEDLFNRATQLTPGGNSMVIPKDETTPWQSSGGIQVYWEGEGSQVTASKPALEMSSVRLVKLMALVPVSDELLEDAPGLESWLMAKAPAKMVAKRNTAVIRGTGVGQPLGILNSPSVISVAKETSQPADTVWFANVNKMWARLYAPWRRNMIWLINQDVEPQLEAMAFSPTGVTPTAASLPVYLPAGGLSASPYGTLKGRPVVPIEACSTIGDQGDIIAVDMNQYWALKKAGGLRTDTSMHLYFDQALTAFRFIFRLNGQPAWSAPITPENGTMTRSWAVTLDAR